MPFDGTLYAIKSSVSTSTKNWTTGAILRQLLAKGLLPFIDVSILAPTLIAVPNVSIAPA